jgi:hypothetical protein
MYELLEEKLQRMLQIQLKSKLIKTEVTLPWGIYITWIRKICFVAGIIPSHQSS